MKRDTLALLQSQLIQRGYSTEGEAPNMTMTLGSEYLQTMAIADLFELLVARREKVFRSVPVVGEELARQSYSDVVLAIDAVKVTIATLVEEV